MDTHSGKPTVLSILYVDDDEATLSLLAAILKMKYPDVLMYSACDGKNGLELYKQHRQNIVITDICLPKMGGIELATEIKRLDALAQIILLSGDPKKQYKSILSKIGINHYIQKPISLYEIFTAIEDCNA